MKEQGFELKYYRYKKATIKVAIKLCSILHYKLVFCQVVFALCQGLFERNSYYEINIYIVNYHGVDKL